jgi:hypothetical protein
MGMPFLEDSPGFRPPDGPSASPASGHLGGHLCGAAAAAARRMALRPSMRGLRIVVILPDTGERYLSTALVEEATP